MINMSSLTDEGSDSSSTSTDSDSDAVADDDGKWKSLTALRSPHPYWNPVCNLQSIWISTEYDNGDEGMVEFCIESNTMKQAIAYPHDFKPDGQSVCGVHDNNIMVVDGDNGQMRTFNIINKKYGAVISSEDFHSINVFRALRHDHLQCYTNIFLVTKISQQNNECGGVLLSHQNALHFPMILCNSHKCTAVVLYGGTLEYSRCRSSMPSDLLALYLQ